MSIYLKVQNLPNHWVIVIKQGCSSVQFTPLRINMYITQRNPKMKVWNLDSDDFPGQTGAVQVPCENFPEVNTP